LVKWFNKVPQLPSSCSLQGVFITSWSLAAILKVLPTHC
jgi:hypothetical protein